jgi:hypothetical protein
MRLFGDPILRIFAYYFIYKFANFTNLRIGICDDVDTTLGKLLKFP